MTFHARLAAIVAAFCLALAASATAQDLPMKPATAALVTIDGAIGPAASDYVLRSLSRAAEAGHPLVILQIDTPGGLDSSTREIVQAILASAVPVAGYVAPSGARAASAGTYILYAAHIAAMAPGTNVGAATPVQIGGGGSPLPGGGRSSDDEEDQGPDASTRKAISDSTAYLKSLAELRGRNVEWAEAAVRESASISAQAALEAGVIDLIATSPEDLLAQLDGRTIDTSLGPRRLDTAGLGIERFEPDWRTKVLSAITNPNVAYILLLIGVYGLLLEFYSPGTFIAGITGAICLFLGLYALNLLPVNYAGFALVGLGMILMVSEAFMPSFGALGIGGAIAFVVGSLMLMDTDIPGFQISPVFIGSIAALSSGLFLFVMWMLLRSRDRAVVTGPEEMLSATGEVVDWAGGTGHVRIRGEIWTAASKAPLTTGDEISVTGRDGLALDVIPREETPK